MIASPANKCKIPQAFWPAFREIGLRPSAILRQARLPVLIASDAQRTVTTDQMFSLWRAVEDLGKDDGLAIRLLRALDVTGHQPVFLAACYAADFRDAIARVDRFKRLSPSEELIFEENDSTFTIMKNWPYASEPEPTLSVDLSFAFVVELGRKGTGVHVTPLRIEYTRQDPQNDALEAYFDCEIRYGAPCDKLVMRQSDINRPFPGHNQEFLDLITPALANARPDLDAEVPFIEQVKAILKHALAGGKPDMRSVAQELGTSERTLQRRIAEENTSFRTLLSEARQEVGTQLLSDRSLGIDEVACLLGYQDTSSFYRAFREREGVTPQHWRRQNNSVPLDVRSVS